MEDSLSPQTLDILDRLHRDWFFEEDSLGLDRLELGKALQHIALAHYDGLEKNGAAALEARRSSEVELTFPFTNAHDLVTRLGLKQHWYAEEDERHERLEEWTAPAVLLRAAVTSKTRVRAMYHAQRREQSEAMLAKTLSRLWKNSEVAEDAKEEAKDDDLKDSGFNTAKRSDPELEVKEKNQISGATMLTLARDVSASVGEKGHVFLNSIFVGLGLQIGVRVHPVVWAAERDFLLESFSLEVGEECLSLLFSLGAIPLSPQEAEAADLVPVGVERHVPRAEDGSKIRFILPRDISDKRCRGIRRAMLRGGRQHCGVNNKEVPFGQGMRTHKHGNYFIARGIQRTNADGAFDEPGDGEDGCCTCLCLW